MKKIIKSRVFAFVLGAIIFGSIGVVSAYSIFANDIGYTPKDTTWKKSNGEDITNVKDAIDDLYSKADDKIILNTFGNSLYNQSMGNIIANRNTSVNLTQGKYIVNALYSVAWSNYQAYQATIEDSHYVSLATSNGTANINKLSGKVYKISGTAQFDSNKGYDIDYLESSVYYINVTSSEATINLSYTAGTYTDNVQAQIVALQAIPIN